MNWKLAGMVVMAGLYTVSSFAAGNGDRYVGAPFATRAPVIAQHGMAATMQPLASQIAIDVLKKGGTAVDAAIAANAALGLMEPVSCGVGGDLFAIVWDPKTKRLYGYNGSGRSPKGRTLADMKRKLGGRSYVPGYGSLSVTVPGTVDGWYALHDKFGKLPMADLLAPAISYAREGFPVSQYIAALWAANMDNLAGSADVEEFENAQHTYLVNGAPPAQGQMFKNPDLARTYQALATGGRDAFYKGAVAKTMDAYFRRIGGDLRAEDFAAHHGEWIDPISVNYRGYDVYEMPPNSQGAAALEMLKILEAYDLRKMGPGSADTLHLLIEAKRLAYEDLAKYFGDPDFAKVPVKTLLSADYAKQRRAQIHMDRANPNIGPGDAKLVAGDTTYLTVADKDGMMISLIQSNYADLGSGLVADGLGFMFHDRGALFSLDERSPNVYAPGKRPFNTIIPGFVMKDGEPYLSFGLMGGDMQPQGHAQVLVNIIDFGMNPQEAGDFMRFRHVGGTEVTGQQSRGVGLVQMESGITPSVRAELTKRGHQLIQGSGGFGGYQAILRDKKNGVYWGATEMRKDGVAIGY
ncbi:MAG: gamma-glutamyltranspeptidase / glutathione hydrolase [Alphaproteobacteria bacterium]|nr:gamma-glutamyltranspeptidase / glutathione hydrolase [Alphaproteobacteria bacterium]